MKLRTASVPVLAFSLAADAPWLLAAGIAFWRGGQPTLIGTGFSWGVQTPIVLLIAIVPLVAHLLIADQVDQFSPRLSFRRGILAAMFRGTASGLISLLAAAFLTTYFDTAVNSGVIVASACIASALFWSLTAARARANHCTSCGYDLSSTSTAAPCPECGRVFSRL